MGRKGISRHRKRLSAPITYPIKRKHGIFTIRPYPTRSKMESSLPLGIVMREMLGYAKNLSEVRSILVRRMVKVDGKVRTSYKFALGPMDILEIPKTEEYFRFTPYRGKRRLKLHPISKEETQTKLLRIERKKTIKGGRIQLTFHDGRNHTLNPEEEQKIPISEIRVKDSVMFNLEDKIITDHYQFMKNKTALIMGGQNIGIVGKIQTIESETSTVTLKTEDEEIKTTERHIFVIGHETPIIEIPEEREVIEATEETGAETDEL